MTTGNVQQILLAAREAVDTAAIPEDLRPIAFGKVIDILASGAPTGAGAAASSGPSPRTNGVVSDRLAKIAISTGAPADKLEYVYDLDDEDVTIVVPRSKLASTKAGATKEIALLYCVARQVGGYDESHTSIEAIRGRVEDMGVYDSANFATDLKKIDGLTAKGNGSNREFKATRHAQEEAGKLIVKLTGGNS